MDHTKVTLTGLTEKAVAQAASGDLEIEGWLARFNEPDRQGEFFMDGAFDHAISRAADGSVPILYQHKDGQQLGQVTELTKKAEGVWMKGVIPKPAQEWALDVYNNLKRGMTRGLSAKGIFTKQLLADGQARIGDVDLFEASVTPVAVGSTATIEAVAEKALSSESTADILGEGIDAYFTDQFAKLEAAFGPLG